MGIIGAKDRMAEQKAQLRGRECNSCAVFVEGKTITAEPGERQIHYIHEPMHLHTIVKVRADTAKQARDRVLSLVESEMHEATGFDWYDADGFKVIPKGEGSFNAAIEEELRQYKFNLDQAETPKRQGDMDWYGYYLIKAGECLYRSRFWSTERLAFDLDWLDGKHIYYVTTDRHY